MDRIPGLDTDTVKMDTVREETTEGFRLYVREEEDVQEQSGHEQHKAHAAPLLPPPSFLGEGSVLEEVSILSEGEAVSDVVMAGGSDSEAGGRLGGQGDMSGNHSSEEELEEIITKARPGFGEREGGKRKWQDLSQSESSGDSGEEGSDGGSDGGWEEPELRPQQGGLSPSQNRQVCVSRSTSTSADSSSCETPSGDEEINHNQPAPVQFSMSPPVDVHKPRRSLSPPPKLFGFTRSSPPPPSLGNFSSSLGDLPTLMSTGDDSTSSVSRRTKTISPRKRSRTSRLHHIQRPCLDFEKMQQLRARAVSWRHGGELSLFCW